MGPAGFVAITLRHTSSCPPSPIIFPDDVDLGISPGDSVAVSTVAELADKLITKGFADIRLPHHRLDRHAANSGQVCNALSRILVPDARKDEFVDALAAGMRSMRVGDPSDPDTQIGPLVAERQQARVRGYIEDGLRAGARLVVGGADLPEEVDCGWYVKPTLFSAVHNNMRIGREEIFGPVLTVIPYGSDDEAVCLANDSEYGLAGSVFMTDLERGFGVATRVRSGTFGVNEGYIMDPIAPFGGVKSSGYGRELGREGFDSYLVTQSISCSLGTAL
jgi:acyl-CoA reductase-like NAD-dependent aldehyde dehydrogenase